jgi:hypothetical protein
MSGLFCLNKAHVCPHLTVPCFYTSSDRVRGSRMKSNRINSSLGSVALCLSLVLGWLAIPFTTDILVAGAAEQCPNGPLAAALTGSAISGTTPSGTARYRERGSNRLIVNVRGVNLGTTSSLNVLVGDTVVGTISLLGRNGQLQVDSPGAPIDENSVISIRSGANVVLTGTFACVAGGPKANPTTSPTGLPTPSPTGSPTASPTGSPTASPTASPSVSPAASPSVSPTASPTMMPF